MNKQTMLRLRRGLPITQGEKEALIQGGILSPVPVGEAPVSEEPQESPEEPEAVEASASVGASEEASEGSEMGDDDSP